MGRLALALMQLSAADADLHSYVLLQQANDSDEDQETCLHHLLIHIQPDLLAETE